MGLFDHLFKSKSPAGEEKVNEPAVEGPAHGKPPEGNPKTPAPHRADPSAFLHPKSHVPRGAQGLTPAPAPGSRPSSAASAKSPERRSTTTGNAPAADEIVLTLGDVLSRIPSPYLKAGAHDAKRELRFKITDLSSDIGRGRAAVPLSRIAQLAPDIFVKEITQEEDTEVRLPLQKLVEQIGLLRSRPGAGPGPEKATRSGTGVELPSSIKPIEAKVVFPPPKTPAPAPTPASEPAPAPFVSVTEKLGPMPVPTPPTRPPIILAEPAPAANAFELKPLVEQPAAKQVILGPPPAVEPPPVRVPEAKAEPVAAPVIPEPVAPAVPQVPVAPTPLPVPVVPSAPVEAVVHEVLPPQPPVAKEESQTVAESAEPKSEATPTPVEVESSPVAEAAPSAPAPETPAPVAPPLAPAPAEPEKIVIDWGTPEPSSVDAEPAQASKVEEVNGVEEIKDTEEEETSQIAIEPARFDPAAQGPKLAPLESPDLDPGEEKIHLSLAAILKHCPPEIVLEQLPHVDDSVRITLPFAPIDRQLVKGRVEISALRFIVALPEVYQKYFVAKVGVKVPIPLEEVFQNLPSPKHELVPSPPVPPPVVLKPAALTPPPQVVPEELPEEEKAEETHAELPPAPTSEALAPSRVEEAPAPAAVSSEEKPVEAANSVEPSPIVSSSQPETPAHVEASTPPTPEPVPPLFAVTPPPVFLDAMPQTSIPPIVPVPETETTEEIIVAPAAEVAAPAASEETAEQAPKAAEPPPLPPLPTSTAMSDTQATPLPAFVPPWMSMPPVTMPTPAERTPVEPELTVARPVQVAPAATPEEPTQAVDSVASSAPAPEAPVSEVSSPVLPPPLPVIATTPAEAPAPTEVPVSTEALPPTDAAAPTAAAMPTDATTSETSTEPEPAISSEPAATAEPVVDLHGTFEPSAEAEPPKILEPATGAESPSTMEPAAAAEPPKVVFQRPLFRPQFIPPPPIFGFAPTPAPAEPTSEPEVKPEPPSLLAGLKESSAPTLKPTSSVEIPPLDVDLSRDVEEAKSEPIDGAASPAQFDAPAAEAQTFASVSSAISEAPKVAPILPEPSDAEPSAELIASAGEHEAPDIVPFSTEPVPFADLAESLAHETTYASDLAEVVHVDFPEAESAERKPAAAKESAVEPVSPKVEEPVAVPMAEGLAVAAVAATIAEHVPLDFHEVVAPVAETPESVAAPSNAVEIVAAESELAAEIVEEAATSEKAPEIEEVEAVAEVHPPVVEAPADEKPSRIETLHAEALVNEPATAEPAVEAERKVEEAASEPKPLAPAEAIAPEKPVAADSTIAEASPVPPPRAEAAPETSAPVVPEPVVVPPSPIFPLPKAPAEPVHLEVLPPPALPLRRFDQDAVQALFMTEETLDLPKISRLAASLPGIYACVIATRDQACTGGTLPEGFDLAALLGLAPRVGEAAGRMPIGQLKHFTLYGDAYSVSFFERNGLSICAVHRPRSFVPGVREKLVALADELSR